MASQMSFKGYDCCNNFISLLPSHNFITCSEFKTEIFTYSPRKFPTYSIYHNFYLPRCILTALAQAKKTKLSWTVRYNFPNLANTVRKDVWIYLSLVTDFKGPYLRLMWSIILTEKQFQKMWLIVPMHVIIFVTYNGWYDDIGHSLHYWPFVRGINQSPGAI